MFFMEKTQKSDIRTHVGQQETSKKGYIHTLGTSWGWQGIIQKKSASGSRIFFLILFWSENIKYGLCIGVPLSRGINNCHLSSKRPFYSSIILFFQMLPYYSRLFSGRHKGYTRQGKKSIIGPERGAIDFHSTGRKVTLAVNLDIDYENRH